MSLQVTHKELTHKIKKAIELIKEGKRVFIDEKIHGEIEELENLGIDESEVFEVIGGFLNEILGYGASKCWRGSSPPMKSYEKKIKGCDLWAFEALCTRLNRQMYLKFALKQNKIFVYVSFHISKRRR